MSLRRTLLSALAVPALVLPVLAVPSPAVASMPAADPAQAMFGPWWGDWIGSQPETVAIGDVTGDGRADALMATTDRNTPELDYRLYVFAQLPDGTLAEPVGYLTSLSWTDLEDDGAGLAVLDTDGDGRQDVALATDLGVEVFRQQAAGTLAAGRLLPGTAHAATVVAADMDGDGDSDLVTGGLAGINLLTRAADGSFAVEAVSTEPTFEVETGDLDGDGRVDIAGFYGPRVFVHHQRAGWPRTEPRPVLAFNMGVDGIEVADVSGDDRADLVLTSGGNVPNARVNVFTQDAAGRLGSPAMHLTIDGSEAVESADIDGDGRRDLFVVHGGWSTLSALLQAPDGTMGARAWARLPYATSYHTQGLAVGDVTGDGRVDAVLADYNNGLVVVPGSGAAPPGRDDHVWVSAVHPAAGATGVAADTAPRIVLNRRPDPESLGVNTVYLENASTQRTVGADLHYDPATLTVTLTPHVPLKADTPYWFIVNRVKDVAGVMNIVPWRVEFTTAKPVGRGQVPRKPVPTPAPVPAP